jgi:outer membrane protein TolC
MSFMNILDFGARVSVLLGIIMFFSDTPVMLAQSPPAHLAQHLTTDGFDPPSSGAAGLGERLSPTGLDVEDIDELYQIIEERLQSLPRLVLEQLKLLDLDAPAPWQVSYDAILDEIFLSLPTSDGIVEVSEDSPQRLVRNIYPITLPQALERSRQTNRDIRLAQLAVAEADNRLSVARQALAPQLSFGILGNAGYGENYDDIITTIAANPVTSEIRLRANETETWLGRLEVSAGAQYGLIDNQRGARIQQSEGRLTQAELSFRQTLINVPADVASSYYGTQAAQATVWIALQAVGRDVRLLRDSLDRKQAGTGSDLEVQRARASLQEDIQLLIQSLRADVQALFGLAQLLNLPPDTIVTPSEAIQQAETWPLSFEVTLALAYDYRVDLQILAAQKSVLEANLAEIDGRDDPVLNVGARAALGPGLTTVNRGAITQETEGFGNYFVGLNLNWELYDNGRQALDIGQAQIALERNQLELANRRDQIREEVVDAYYDMLANQVSIDSAELLVELRNQRVQELARQFETGEDVQDELFQENRDLLLAQINLVNTIIRFNQATVALETAIGFSPWLDYADTGVNGYPELPIADPQGDSY